VTDIRLLAHEYCSFNIMTVRVGTNCPRGGDSGHGGRTIIEFEDLSSTDMSVTLNGEEQSLMGNKIRLVFGGDCECDGLIECLEFAAKALKAQSKVNAGTHELEELRNCP
jgi:hypothetical protein